MLRSGNIFTKPLDFGENELEGDNPDERVGFLVVVLDEAIDLRSVRRALENNPHKWPAA